MRIKPTILLIILTLLVSTKLSAKDLNFSTECGAEVRSEMSFYNGELIITTKNNDQIMIDSYGNTWINDNKVNLSNQELAATQDYYEKVERLLPKILDIASSAIAITQTTLIEVFGELFGHDSEFIRDFDDALNDLQQELEYAFQDEQGQLAIKPDTFVIDGPFATNIEHRAKDVFTEFSARATLEMIKFIGQSMFSDDANTEELTNKFENFEDDIDAKIESQVSYIEESASRLCDEFSELDQLESELNQVEQLKSLDMIHLNQST